MKKNNFRYLLSPIIPVGFSHMMKVLLVIIASAGIFAAGFSYCDAAIWGGDYSITRAQLGGVSGGNDFVSENLILRRSFSQPSAVGIANSVVDDRTYILISGHMFTGADNPRVIAINPSPYSYAVVTSTSVKVYFDTDIDIATILPAVNIYEKKNNLKENIFRPANVMKEYSPSGNFVALMPLDGNFKGNYQYLVIVSTDVKEPEEGLPLEEPATSYFTTAARKDVRNIFDYEHSDYLKVEVPPGTIDRDEFYILVSTDPINQPIKALPESVRIANAKALSQDGNRRIIDYYEIVPQDMLTNENISQLSGKVDVSLPFSSTKKLNAPYLATYPRLTFKKKYNLYYLDEGRKLWVKVPGASIDLKNGIIKGSLSYLGVFSAIEDPDYDLSTAYAFPVPYSPNENPNHKNIIFGNLATRCTIKIFTISGELVREMEYNANTSGLPYYEWDVKNKDGAPCASGVYIYLIESLYDKKTGKLMIIR